MQGRRKTSFVTIYIYISGVARIFLRWGGGGGVRTRLRAHCVRKGLTKLLPIFFNAGLQAIFLWTDSTWFSAKLNLLPFRKGFWIKRFDSMHDSISFYNWIDSSNDSSGPKINYSNWFMTSAKISAHISVSWISSLFNTYLFRSLLLTLNWFCFRSFFKMFSLVTE